MGFVAVIGPAAADDWKIEVRRIHVNLWCVRRRIAGHALLLDVGVGFNLLSETAPDSLTLLVPVAPDPKDRDGLQDLFPKIREQPTAQLIFGEPVKIETDAGVTRLTADSEQYDRELILTALGTPQIEQVEAGDLWRVTLPFRSPLPTCARPSADSTATGTAAAATAAEHYVRFRIHIGQRGSVWSWKRHGPLLPKIGVLVDVRIADLRDPVTASGGGLDEARVLPVCWANTFVVAPQWLQSKVAPNIRAVRLLEGAIWQPYLDRRLNPRRRQKSVVYYNREKDVGRDSPGKTFLDLGRENGFTWADYLWLVALSGSAAALVFHGADWFDTARGWHLSVGGAWDAIWTGLDAIGKVVGALTAVAVVVGAIFGVPRRIASRLRRFERDRLAKP